MNNQDKYVYTLHNISHSSGAAHKQEVVSSFHDNI